ncbi:MAG: hypothetical protein ACI8RD_000903 [Bacillariaceae sp.]|jgi:hypothetical protein
MLVRGAILHTFLSLLKFSSLHFCFFSRNPYSIISRTLKKSICCIDTDEDDNFVSGESGSTAFGSRRNRSSLISNRRRRPNTETNNSDVVSGDFVTNINDKDDDDDDNDDDDDDDNRTNDVKSTSLTISKQHIDSTTKTMAHEGDEDKEDGK